jgi:hypothetical protein
MITFRHALLACALFAPSAIAPVALAHGGHTQLVAPADAGAASNGERLWLAGDHHIHSEFSADYQADPANPAAMPKPLFG